MNTIGLFRPTCTSRFDYYHKDYEGSDHFDHYNAELLRAADTLVQVGLNKPMVFIR